MPISTISQTISTIPEAGRRGVDVQTVFVNKQEDFQDHLQGTTVIELNALKTQINTTVSGMNDAVTTVNTKANEASTSASQASSSASTATTKAGEASTSASQALASKNKAAQWADNNYNVEVEAGKYSAKHWATVAQSVDVSTKVDKDMSGYTAKTTPVDADLLPLSDSASSFGIKKLSLMNLKTTIFTNSTLTGTPTAPTQTVGDNSTKVATTEFVQNNKTVSVPTSYHIYNGSVEATNTVLTNGFGTTLYTGNGGTQSINTAIDMDTQWGNNASEKFGGLVWIKSRTGTQNNALTDTVRGNTKIIQSNTTNAESTSSTLITSFNNNGISLGSDNTVNGAFNYASWNFQTTHRTSGTTNHGKAYTCHYNPFTGFTIVKYEGSGIVGHEIPHMLGRKLSFAVVKITSGVDNWYAQYKENSFLYLNTTAAEAANTTQIITAFNETTTQIGNGSGLNGSGSTYIMYGWANSYFDEDNTLIGNYEIGVYQGTGAAGNKVTTRGKPAWVMFKRLDSTGGWHIANNLMAGIALWANLSNAQGGGWNTIYHQDGFVPFNDPEINASGGQYLYMVVYDNDSGSGKSKYPRATDTTNLSINALVPYASGIDTNGSKVSISYKNETISGITLTQGKNYVYSKNDGTYGVSSIAPSYGKDNPLTGDFFNLKTLKWYNSSNVEITPRTYLDCIVYADHNGQVSYVEELPKTTHMTDLKVTDGFDLGQTWQNMTSKRSAGVTYTNNTGKPIIVNITTASSSADGYAQIYINDNLLGIIARYTATGIQTPMSSIIIPNGTTYKVLTTNASIQVWSELR